MNFGVVLSTTLVSLGLLEVSAKAEAVSSLSGMLTMVFGKSGGLRRELVSCATRIGAGFGSFCGMAEAWAAGFFFGAEEQELKLSDVAMQTKARVTRQSPRRNTAENVDFRSFDELGRI
jgi:hypothetical protein